MSKKIETPKDFRDLPKGMMKQMLTMATSGFGLVAALAWNEVVKEFVNSYIKRYFDNNSGLISLAIYALIVTSFAVLVTYQLGIITSRLDPDIKSNQKRKSE